MKGRYLKYYTILLGVLYGALIFFLFGICNYHDCEVSVTAEAATTEEQPVVEEEVPELVEVPIQEDIDIREEVAVITKDKVDLVEETPIELEPTVQAINYSFNVFAPSNYSREDLIRMLGKRSGFIPYVDSFIKAEQTYGVNSLYLIATMGLESGWGKYKSNTNNIAGWKNKTYTGYRAFNSVDECIMVVARGLQSGYQPIGTSLVKVTSRYCPTPGYTDKVISIMKELQRGY